MKVTPRIVLSIKQLQRTSLRTFTTCSIETDKLCTCRLSPLDSKLPVNSRPCETYATRSGREIRQRPRALQLAFEQPHEPIGPRANPGKRLISWDGARGRPSGSFLKPLRSLNLALPEREEPPLRRGPRAGTEPAAARLRVSPRPPRRAVAEGAPAAAAPPGAASGRQACAAGAPGAGPGLLPPQAASESALAEAGG